MSAVPNVAAAQPSGASRRAVPLPRGRRSTELVMLGFAVGVVAFAYAAVGLGLNGHVPGGLVVYVAGFAALMLLAHFAVRKFAPWADPLMLPLAALLNGLGIVMISHNLAAIRHLCDRIGVIHAGRLIFLGKADDFIQANGGASLERAFLSAIERAEKAAP